VLQGKKRAKARQPHGLHWGETAHKKEGKASRLKWKKTAEEKRKGDL